NELKRRSLLISALCACGAYAQKSKEPDKSRVPESMLYIPQGTFVMGAPRTKVSAPAPPPTGAPDRSEISGVRNGGRGPGRGPGGNFKDSRHAVRLSGFFISKYLVTNADYSEFVEAAGRQYRPRYWDNPAFDANAKANHPVLWVGYDEATAYCRWL